MPDLPLQTLLLIGIGALFLIAFAAVILLLWRVKRDMARQSADFERYRRRQFAELSERVERSNERMQRDMQLINGLLNTTTADNAARIEKLLTRMDASLAQQRAESEEMRRTMDNRLRESLEKRLGDSFRQVSEQLERVYKGLGEMRTLAGSVGDLKRVLTGVKTRGTWGEVRLGALLEQNLTPDQYLTNTPVEPGGTERVEYAVRLPGKADDQPVLLAVDAKYPQEDYQRLLDAVERGDKPVIERCALQFERALMEQAARIGDKYIRIPYTTDFAVMFLPTEGLFAEALRRPGLAERMQQKHRVLICGPTTLSALLTSLQMGFKTLAVEARSQEIWRLLGAVREEFARFGEALDRTRQRLDQANAELDAATTRTRKITQKLRRVEGLPVPEEWKTEEQKSPGK